MRIGIIGAGRIATKMAYALSGMKEAEAYAIASRNLGKAEEFAKTNGFAKAYGSYEELIKDPLVDLVYIATPHPFHFEQAKLCLENQKPVIVEKPFTVNKKEAEELFKLAKENNTFITEALWTRYMPSRKIIEKLIEEETIGTLSQLTADLSYPMEKKERVIKKELAGGALLDIGIYPLSLAQTVFKDKPERIDGFCTYLESGVDANDAITLFYPGNKTAVLTATMKGMSNGQGIISGNKGYIVIDHIGNPSGIRAYNNANELLIDVKIPEQINGYEYEIESCIKAIKNKKLECEEHTHADTLELLDWMDLLREKWNVIYPFENRKSTNLQSCG